MSQVSVPARLHIAKSANVSYVSLCLNVKVLGKMLLDDYKKRLSPQDIEQIERELESTERELHPRILR